MANGPGLQHGLGDVFQALIPSLSMSGESRIACLLRLRATTLWSHRNHCTRQQADAETIEFEVMHFVLHVRVWLHQGFHVNPTCLHGHGLCCTTSNPNQPDDDTSGSNILNPPDARRQGPQTRQQSAADAMANAAAAAAAAAAQAAATPAPAASQGAQSVTGIIDYH